MQRYLRPDLLADAGIDDFDTWAATFGADRRPRSSWPPTAAASGMKTRFARFANVPELLRMWHVSADVKTAEDLNLPSPIWPRPATASGHRRP